MSWFASRSGAARSVAEALDLDVFETERFPGGLDVPADELGLPAELVGLDTDVLDERRVELSDHERHERPQTHAQRRQHPAAAADVDQEQHRADQRDDDEHVERRELRVDVGEPRAVDGAPGREVQLVALEPVPGGSNHRDHGQQHRQVDLHRRRHLLERAPHPDPAVEVVSHGHHQEHDDEGREGPLEQELEERELEDVEAHVGVELWILDPEVDAVPEQDPLVPTRRHPSAGDEREQHRDPHADPTGVGADHLAVPLDELLLGARRHEGGRQPVGDDQVGEEDDEEQHGERDRGHDPRPEQSRPDRSEALGVEPQVGRSGQAGRRTAAPPQRSG